MCGLDNQTLDVEAWPISVQLYSDRVSPTRVTEDKIKEFDLTQSLSNYSM